MIIDFFYDLDINFSNINVEEFANDFLKELADYLNDFKDEMFENKKGKTNSFTTDGKDITNSFMKTKDEKFNVQEEKIDDLRKENCLYQVVDLSSRGAYLQNIENNIIFEETNIPDEIKNIISNDYMLRYKNGTYFFEEGLTDEFYKSMVDIKYYKDK